MSTDLGMWQCSILDCITRSWKWRVLSVIFAALRYLKDNSLTVCNFYLESRSTDPNQFHVKCQLHESQRMEEMMSETTPAHILNLPQLRDQLRVFVAERDWQQFHTPKNLASALSVEAAELLEPFQWLKTGEIEELNAETQTAIRHEMADVLNYLVMLADRLNVDLLAAAHEKIQLNAEKYPVHAAHGLALKYTELKK